MNKKQIKKRYDSLIANIEQQRMYDEIVSMVESHRDDFAKAKRIKKLKE